MQRENWNFIVATFAVVAWQRCKLQLKKIKRKMCIEPEVPVSENSNNNFKVKTLILGYIKKLPITFILSLA